MARLFLRVGLCTVIAACTGGSSSSGNEGGRGGAAGMTGSEGVAGFGRDATGGSAGVGVAGPGGRTGSAGAAGMGGTVATGGRGGAAGQAGIGGGNACPVIDRLTATPRILEVGETESLIELEARDPDGGAGALRTRLSATTGVFGDPEASSTTFTCGAPGPAEITAWVTDGDPTCEVERTITLECPDDIPINLCPNLFTVNAIPGNIPPGEDSTEVQTRATDPDDGPLSLVTTFFALYGTFDEPNAADTVYRCERGGLQEICVDASDGACVKTLCADVICPEE